MGYENEKMADAFTWVELIVAIILAAGVIFAIWYNYPHVIKKIKWN